MSAPDARSVPVPSQLLTTDDGPIHEALIAIDQAFTDIEDAKGALVDRRRDFAVTVREQVQACYAAEPADLVTALRNLVSQLYWHHPSLRLTDLAAATGLSNERVRDLAGPMVTERPCQDCGTPTTVLLNSRRDNATRRCRDCRVPAVPTLDPFGPGDLLGDPLTADDLGRLIDHVMARISTEGCDHRLTHTERWARREGFDLGTVMAAVQRYGGFCDCEVVINAPPLPGERPS